MRAREYLSPAREDNWPCITFEALSIRGKLSLSSLFFTLAVPPGEYLLRPGKRIALADERKSEKGLGSVTKEETGRENVRGMSVAYVCTLVYAYVCVHIFIFCTHTYAYYMCVCVHARACVRVCVRVCVCAHRRDISVSSESQEIDLFHITS